MKGRPLSPAAAARLQSSPFAQRIQAYAHEHNLTQVEMADFLDVNYFTLRSWWNGGFEPAAAKIIYCFLDLVDILGPDHPTLRQVLRSVERKAA